MPEDVGRLGRAAVKGSLSVGNVVTVLYYHLHIYTQLTALVSMGGGGMVSGRGCGKRGDHGLGTGSIDFISTSPGPSYNRLNFSYLCNANVSVYIQVTWQ